MADVFHNESDTRHSSWIFLKIMENTKNRVDALVGHRRCRVGRTCHEVH